MPAELMRKKRTFI